MHVRAMHVDLMHGPKCTTNTNGMAPTVAGAFRDIPDAARRRRRVITTCNAVGVVYLTELRIKQ